MFFEYDEFSQDKFNLHMHSIIKDQIVAAILAAYPGVLFVSANMRVNEMQLHYQSRVVTETLGKLSVSENEMKTFCSMLGINEIEKIHIFTTEKIVTFYGRNKKINL